MSKYQINIGLYDMSGLFHNITFGAESIEEIEREKKFLFSCGYSMDKPNPELKPKVYRIVGFVLGEAKDNKRGEMMPCLHLYNDIQAFKYKSATIYHEDMGKIPVDWSKAKRWEAAAPERETAVMKKIFNSCTPFEIVLKPQIDFETKEPRKNEEGDIIYKFSHVLGNANNGVEEKKQKSKSPGILLPTTFESRELALQWAVDVCAFTSPEEAVLAYTKLKNQATPKTSQEMFTLWIDEVKSRLIE